MVGGRYFDKPVRTALSGGVGARAENGALPTAGSFTYLSAQVPVRYVYGVLQISGPVMHMSKGDKSAFAEALAQTMDGVYDEFRLHNSILLYGWGTGTIGEVSSTSSNVITLKDDNLPATWFYNNQVVDTYTADGGGSAHDTGLSVSAVNVAGRTVTTSAQTSTVAGDFIVFGGAGGGTSTVPMGLLGSIDDGTYVS